MNFLRTDTQISYLGYPLIFFYLVALIGFLLIIYRPYWAFLFALFCLAARNFHAAVFTRTPFAGPYLNLNDLLLWIAFFTMIFELLRSRKMILIPKILLAIFILILIGDFQSLFKYGTEEFVLRRIWGVAIFPVLFLVGTNMVKDEKRAKYFYWALFGGAFIAALQHMYFIWSASEHQISGEAQIRTISYIVSGGLFLVISSIFTKTDRNLSRAKLIFYFTGIALIGVSYILSLTRGIYVVTIASLIILPVILRGQYKIHKTIYNIVLLSILIIFLVGILFPNLDFKRILNTRFESLIYKDTFEKAYKTREIGSKTELDLWMNGNLVLGLGSSLPPEYESPDPEITGALYHVGYSTYLVHFGLAGFVIYAIILPFLTIKIARRYYMRYLNDYRGRLALIAITCALFGIFTLPWSHHHLDVTSHMSGLIYGAIWGLYRTERAGERAMVFLKYRPLSFNSSSAFTKYGK